MFGAPASVQIAIPLLLCGKVYLAREHLSVVESGSERASASCTAGNGAYLRCNADSYKINFYVLVECRRNSLASWVAAAFP
jgi:hypothetical protein